MTKPTLTLLVALTTGLSACGVLGEPSVRRDADSVIFQIHSEGGFAPQEWILSRGPVYTLTGDGRLIHEGPVLMIFPGPLLPNYQATQLSEGEVGQLLDLIERMGLPQIVDEVDDTALDFVADATTEVITYWDQNGTHRYGAYALGIDSTPEREATKAFRELWTVLGRLATSGEATSYEGDQVRVLVGPGVIDPEFEDVREWPFEEGLEDWEVIEPGWSCRVFDNTVLDTFADATQSTLWLTPDPDLPHAKLLVRPLHPGESGCSTANATGG